MRILEILNELNKHGIAVSHQAITHLLRRKYGVKKLGGVYDVPEKIGRKIIEYYKIKHNK